MKVPDLPADLADLVPIVRLVSGAPEHAQLDVVTITFRVGDRLVEARRTGHGNWAFSLHGRGRGKRPGIHPERLQRDYRSALADLQQLRQHLQRKADVTALIAERRWLRKLALVWTPSSPKVVPPWLKEHVEDMDAEIGPSDAAGRRKLAQLERQAAERARRGRPAKPGHSAPSSGGPRFVIRVPIHRLRSSRLKVITADDDEPALEFEARQLDLSWNHFVLADFEPSALAERIVAIFHGLSASYVRQQKASGRG